jgi:hypothetical protein
MLHLQRSTISHSHMYTVVDMNTHRVAGMSCWTDMTMLRVVVGCIHPLGGWLLH